MGRLGSCTHGTNIGSEYTAEELEFLRAIDRYKRAERRPYPTWIEVLDVLRKLGWRKVNGTEESNHARQRGTTGRSR